jgi:hypothetical protein
LVTLNFLGSPSDNSAFAAPEKVHGKRESRTPKAQLDLNFYLYYVLEKVDGEDLIILEKNILKETVIP